MKEKHDSLLSSFSEAFCCFHYYIGSFHQSVDQAEYILFKHWTPKLSHIHLEVYILTKSQYKSTANGTGEKCFSIQSLK